MLPSFIALEIVLESPISFCTSTRIMGSVPEEPRFTNVPFRLKSDVVPRATGYSAQEARQSQFLQRIAGPALQEVEISSEQEQQIEKLRRHLELVCQTVVQVVESKLDRAFQYAPVKLEIMGSYKTGFALNESNVDFILTSSPSTVAILEAVPQLELRVPENIQMLSVCTGCAARLITRNRELLLEGCQFPTAIFDRAICMEIDEARERWDSSYASPPNHLQEEIEHIQDIELVRRLDIALKEGWMNEPHEYDIVKNFKHAFEASVSNDEQSDSILTARRADLSRLQHVLKRYHEPQNPDLMMPKSGVGIKWTMHFAPEPVRVSTQLLWCYGNCEPRVQEFVRFIKIWAKRRDINDPQRGTLSSYGYTLMALHFLINVAQPPGLPNLQEEFEDFNRDNSRHERALEQAMESQRECYNKVSLGSLLRGFFTYFNNPKAKIRKNRFAWGPHAVSIRTRGGIITKQVKGWTSSDTEVAPSYFPWKKPFEIRQRHLLSIEDPLNTDLDIGSTVSYPGMCKVKDEFKRANRIVENLGNFPGSKTMDLLEVTNHSDLDRPWLYFGKKPSKESPHQSISGSVQEDLPPEIETINFKSRQNEQLGMFNLGVEEPTSENGCSGERHHMLRRMEANIKIEDNQGQTQVNSFIPGPHVAPTPSRSRVTSESSCSDFALRPEVLPVKSKAQKSSQHAPLQPVLQSSSVTSSLNLTNLKNTNNHDPVPPLNLEPNVWSGVPDIANHPNLTGENQPLSHGDVSIEHCKPDYPTQANLESEPKEKQKSPSTFQTLREMAVKPNESLVRIGLLTGSEADAGVWNIAQAKERTFKKRLKQEQERKTIEVKNPPRSQVKITPSPKVEQANKPQISKSQPKSPGRNLNATQPSHIPFADSRVNVPNGNGNGTTNVVGIANGHSRARHPPFLQAPVDILRSQAYNSGQGRGGNGNTSNITRGGRPLRRQSVRGGAGTSQQVQGVRGRGVGRGGPQTPPTSGRWQFRGRGQVLGSGITPGRGNGQDKGRGGLFRGRGGVLGSEWV